MSLVAGPKGLPPAYGGCNCSCHRVPGIMHVAACCRPSDADRQAEWYRRMAEIEGGSEIGAGFSIFPDLTPPMTDTNPIEAGIPGVEVVAWLHPNGGWVSMAKSHVEAYCRIDGEDNGPAPLVRKSDYDALAEQNAALVKIARDLTKGLVQLTPSGSEYFTRHGDEYFADVAACQRVVRDRFESGHRAKIELVDVRRERDALSSRLQEAEKALEWYEEQVRNCRKLHGIPEGDAARNALSNDGGKRARAALANKGESDAG